MKQHIETIKTAAIETELSENSWNRIMKAYRVFGPQSSPPSTTPRGLTAGSMDVARKLDPAVKPRDVDRNGGETMTEAQCSIPNQVQKTGTRFISIASKPLNEYHQHDIV